MNPISKLFPYAPIAKLPTRVEPVGDGLYVKRDDQTGTVYGGNKVRKLAFLLGRAKAEGAEAVITFGAAGSNHALATAIYARELGLRAHSMLVPQANARIVGRNLLRGHTAGAILHYGDGRRAINNLVVRVMREEYGRTGRYPHVIPAGGSSPVGVLGFVDAAFELAAQVREGLLPEPDVVYVASGTMGTCIGLLLGLALAGMKTQVVAISVTSAPYSCAEKSHTLFHATNRLLHAADDRIPLLDFPGDRFGFRTEFLGPGYAVYTEESVAAVARAREMAGLKLEGTYTGKAFAALLHDRAAGSLDAKQALFWNTYNTRNLEGHVEDYRDLPEAFHRYFEEPVQPLDQ